MASNPPDANQKRLIEATVGQISDASGFPEAISAATLGRVELDTILELRKALPADAKIDAACASLDKLFGTKVAALTLEEWGKALIALSNIQRRLDAVASDWATSLKADRPRIDGFTDSVAVLVARARRQLSQRPDVTAIMGNLSAIKSLQGGPADAEAFHDFHTLQVAWRHVWLHSFDANLQSAAEMLYEQLIEQPSDTDIVVEPVQALGEFTQLKELVRELLGKPFQSPIEPDVEVVALFGPIAIQTWPLLSREQCSSIVNLAHYAKDAPISEAERERTKAEGLAILNSPAGYGARLFRTLTTLDRALNECYAFDTFAPDTYNYGLMLTYRQRWIPGAYQAGNLVATIPLAPGETRKFNKRHVVKKSRAEKEIEKALSTRSEQASQTSRAETEIMKKAESASNFKLTSSGSFNIGIGSISASSEMGANQADQSIANKKGFQEATRKAAEEYRLERSIEIDTAISEEWEESSSGELSNPNNELTVTYLFYELQRRYRIQETLHRVRPVILVAQDVPPPHEINEGWLIQHQWILNRVLLDDMFKPALQYLVSGFTGDEVSIEVLRGQWEKQRNLVEKLETLVDRQLQQRDQLRRELIEATMSKDKLPNMPGALKVFTLGVDPSEGERTELEAIQRAGETRLKYAEEAALDIQDKLKSAATVFERVTQDYVTAVRNKFSRDVAIDQLRVHVKENILYYMQAIWDHEPPDQRYFRLYTKKIICPEPLAGCQLKPKVDPTTLKRGARMASSVADVTELGVVPGPKVVFEKICQPATAGGGVGGLQHELVEVADLDNPLGYKGNYIIFPLKNECYLTFHMLLDFLDEELFLRDPDGSDDFDETSFEAQWDAAANDPKARVQLRKQLAAYIEKVNGNLEEIIVPTGQLFIEALPGSHPLLEDFKLLHRFEDVRKVRAEVRHAELENIRLASRLIEAHEDTRLLEDPDIEKKVVVDGAAGLNVGTDS